MKKFWLTHGRERNLMRYSETFADAFLQGVMSNPFNDWIQF